ncbi:LOW QUALITY PROTEIN: uncharacterized protein Dere_GG26793, partial [Drosophila erecta]
MHFALRLSFLLAVLFSLTGRLQIEVQQTDDANTQLEIADEVIEIYNKYKAQQGSDVAKEAQLNTQVNDFKGGIVLVDGVPVQGVQSIADKLMD